ncbi:hypothetical protein COJ27_29875 [Bacillus cereus]|uniref:dTMP kinase n=1 Tax=Bacillus cereus TaxID=1396 RepID=UPI000BF5E512|nr:hypothetical protein [Bacillus cereus]PFL57212.1 hypothetical protein COJ27_29875 [Bacillus cereus]
MSKKGCIIAFEGIHSSGKSTLIENFITTHIIPNNIQFVMTDWNSSKILDEHVVHLKRNLELDPYTLIFLELADFSYRFEHIIKPAIEKGKLVLLDRSLFTTVTRGIVRDIPKEYLLNLISLFPLPDICIYLDTQPEEALKRRINKKGCFEGYLSGSDYLDNKDLYINFLEYSRALRAEYKGLYKDTASRFLTIEQDKSVAVQCQDIWNNVEDILK